MSYPNYCTYEDLELSPSVLAQEFPIPTKVSMEYYYPTNNRLAPYFSTDLELRRFCAASFCGFLEDTMDVEHSLVVPAIASLSRIDYKVPPKEKQDLFKTATDECFHAEQALYFLSVLRDHFQLVEMNTRNGPLFLRRLKKQISQETDTSLQFLMTILNGVVTETRISKELSVFARNESLVRSVRHICDIHARDEAIHASQFQALGRWLWQEFDEETKLKAAEIYIASSVARSLPDLESLANMVYQSTTRNLFESKELVYKVYDAQAQFDEMLFAARPTLKFLKRLGVEDFIDIDEALNKELDILNIEMKEREQNLMHFA